MTLDVLWEAGGDYVEKEMLVERLLHEYRRIQLEPVTPDRARKLEVNERLMYEAFDRLKKNRSRRAQP